MGQPTRARRIAAFAAKFAAIVPACLVAWWLFLPVYARFLGLVATLILKYINQVPIESFVVSNAGIANKAGLLNTGTALSFVVGGRQQTLPELGSVVTNVAPFLALVLATPRLGWKRRGLIIGIGVLILVVTHISFVLMAYLAGQSEVSMAIGQAFITLPFLLWIVLAYWDKASAYFAKPSPSPDISRDGGSGGEGE